MNHISAFWTNWWVKLPKKNKIVAMSEHRWPELGLISCCWSSYYAGGDGVMLSVIMMFLLICQAVREEMPTKFNEQTRISFLIIMFI